MHRLHFRKLLLAWVSLLTLLAAWNAVVAQAEAAGRLRARRLARRSAATAVEPQRMEGRSWGYVAREPQAVQRYFVAKPSPSGPERIVRGQSPATNQAPLIEYDYYLHAASRSMPERRPTEQPRQAITEPVILDPPPAPPTSISSIVVPRTERPVSPLLVPAAAAQQDATTPVPEIETKEPPEVEELPLPVFPSELVLPADEEGPLLIIP